MIRLTQPTSDLISLITAQNGAKTVAAFTDTTATTWGGLNEVHSITTATTTTIVATPAASTIREIDFINIYNTYAGAQLLTVQMSVSATLYIMVAVTLLQGESLRYTHADGWCALDVNGNRKEVTAAFTTATRQVFLTGTAATYTTPVAVRQLKIRFQAGGGGGSGTGTTGPNDGNIGGTTTFNSITAIGGAGGASGNGLGGVGGTGGTGTASLRLSGINGYAAMFVLVSATNGEDLGGAGGGFGGGMGGGASTNGFVAVANTGGGGGGAGVPNGVFAVTSTFYLGAGGGSGEYVEIVINTPASSYTYTVGDGGTGGTSGTSGHNGGTGGSGYITVDEYY